MKSLIIYGYFQRLSSLVAVLPFQVRPILCSKCISVLVANHSKAKYSQRTSLVFDRRCKKLQKELCNRNLKEIEKYEYLRNEIAFRVADRIADINRDFPLMYDLGCGRGHISSQLTEEDSMQAVIQGDIAFTALDHSLSSVIPVSTLLADEESMMFRKNVFDLVTSSLTLHWVNDLPECFSKVLQMLKPDGCFLGAVFGGDTLFELRCSLQLAETEREGGMAPHVSPFLQGRDVANLLTSSGFNLVTVDMDEVVISYPSMFEVLEDLKGMGENNSLMKKKPLHRDTLAAAASIYKAFYGNEDESVPASYQILYFIGWKPDKLQSQPLERGSTPKGFQYRTP